MVEDRWLSPWSTLVDGVQQWIRREMAEDRGPTRAICMRCDAVGASDQPAGELSYWLVPEARGRGLAYAAVRLMIDSVAPALGLRSVVLDIEEGNVPSIRLAERLGAERRSPARAHPDRFGTQHTMVVYVLPVAAGLRS